MTSGLLTHSKLVPHIDTRQQLILSNRETSLSNLWRELSNYTSWRYLAMLCYWPNMEGMRYTSWRNLATIPAKYGRDGIYQLAISGNNTGQIWKGWDIPAGDIWQWYRPNMEGMGYTSWRNLATIPAEYGRDGIYQLAISGNNTGQIWKGWDIPAGDIWQWYRPNMEGMGYTFWRYLAMIPAEYGRDGIYQLAISGNDTGRIWKGWDIPSGDIWQSSDVCVVHHHSLKEVVMVWKHHDQVEWGTSNHVIPHYTSS